MQIKTCRLEHQCWSKNHTRKIIIKFLAIRYLEVWRNYLEWDLVKGLQNKVKEDYGIVVAYHKCWYTRAKAKIMLYGDGAEQYKKVYDYATTVLKYNPGSIALVGVMTGLEGPLFQKMFMCLKPVLDGF